MGVGKLIEMVVKRSAGDAARGVQDRFSAAASGRGNRVNWWVDTVPGGVRTANRDPSHASLEESR